MLAWLLIAGSGLLGIANTSAANQICEEAPAFSDPAISRGVAEAVKIFAIWSGSGGSFARLAADQYGELAQRHPAAEARKIAVALLQAECIELMWDQDPARLPWHIKDRLEGLSRIIPDFDEAHALLDRIKAAEAGR